MKVLLRRNISKLGKIGDVVQVKNGYARNYLLPQGLAVQPTEANIRAVDAEKQRYLEELAKQRSELEAKAAVLQGRELIISARTNEEGHLYGSIGPAQIVAALAADGVFIDSEHLDMDHSIRQVGDYEITARFGEDVTATMQLSVIAVSEGDEEVDHLPADEPAEAEDAEEASPDEKIPPEAD